jgi:N6-adenosine-specific RNA methylase IME4
MIPSDALLIPGKDIENQPWFQQLVDDCQTIIIETQFTARWALIEGWHAVGSRIANEPHLKKQGGSNLLQTLKRVSKFLNTGERTLYKAVQFARQYPDLSMLPEGKNVTWRYVCNELLPETKKQYELPAGKYRVIYADPPWKYSSSGLDQYGPAERHYDSLSIKELCGYQDKNGKKISELAGEDAVLFLWVTSGILAECWPVIDAWGFNYKSSFIWDKIKHNYGHYNSVRHELLLICTRGSCLPDEPKLFDSVVEFERSEEHSEKPGIFREMIDVLYPIGRRIELFARSKTKGWETFGDEL